MNTLSILLYLADVSDSFGWIFDWLFALSLIASILTLFIWKIAYGDYNVRKGPDHEENAWVMQVMSVARKLFVRWFFPILAVSFFASGLIPSKETVYAIAASELGENVAKSEVGDKVYKALNGWIDKQIAGESTAEAGNSTN